MKHRRIEFFLMLVALLIVNFFALLWLQGRPFAAVWANGLAAPATAPLAVATIPRIFSYQGTLRDANGNLINGTVNLTLKLYKDVTGGNALHMESFANVPVRTGLFSVVVGDATPIASAVFDNAPLYLGLSINQDPEMLPRQRLHPVPFAMQANTAQTAVTANTLVPGGGVPNLVTFGAGGAKQIGFPDGGQITDSATGMTIRGGGANKAVTITGDLFVTGNGNWSVAAILDKGDSKGGPNVRSTYPMSMTRYMVEAPDNGRGAQSVPVDDTILRSLCEDRDGCTVTLGMGSTNTQIPLVTVGPFRFSLGSISNGIRSWRSSSQTGDAAPSVPVGPFSMTASDQDNNGNNKFIARALDCWFIDGEAAGEPQLGTDNALGFSLLNGFGLNDNSSATCVLIIED